MIKSVLLICCSLIAGNVNAYEITGRLKISGDWQSRIFLASVNSPDKLFVASPEFVIDEALIDGEGRFILRGLDLPEDSRFYRLYLVRNNVFGVEFMTDSVRNFMHLILDNQTTVFIENADERRVFESVQMNGSEKNSLLADFEKTYFQKRNQLSGVNTSAKRNFQSQSLNKYIREFTENCPDPLVALFALYHLDDRETDFLQNSDFYFRLQDRLQADRSYRYYAHIYDDLLNSLVGYRDLVCAIPSITKPWRDWVIWGETVLIFLLVFLLFKKKRNIRKRKGEPDFVSLLTEKERTIWQSLAAGKTNKEIATDLYIEISTVKTHINNLYKRLGVTNRKEAISLYNHLNPVNIKGD
ncbi:helix-turn-helix transcriptional regulator [Gaoshiqia sp. Z1-71]|uniref:helix-turn-helix transcriptional regulator n=1 Tax=Gaoshiqia hydrogeniformans TaxID=3290090 RepID=UPI003BF7C9AC